MQFQRTPLPAVLDYFLDGALNTEEISALCYNAITLLGDRKIVPAIVDADADDPRRHTLRNRRGRAMALNDYAHQLVADLATHEQAAFYASNMLREPLKMYGLAEWLCSWNHEDETIGGCGKDYRDVRRHDANFDPTPRVRRHLYAPSAIRRYVKAEGQCLPYARRLAEPLAGMPAGLPAEAQLIVDLMDEQRSSYREAMEASRAEFTASLFWNHARDNKPRVLTKTTRKAVTRAAAVATGIIGQAQVSAFTKGRAILLQGTGIALELRTSGDIARLGHGAMTVNLCTPAGDRLSGLCVYFDKTPVLDQVAAIALHLQAGCESDLINTGNLFAITPLGAAHPVVAARVAKNKVNVGTADWHRPNDRERKDAAQARYKADTIRIYYDAVVTTVWGRNAPRLAPFEKSMFDLGVAVEEMRHAA